MCVCATVVGLLGNTPSPNLIDCGISETLGDTLADLAGRTELPYLFLPLLLVHLESLLPLLPSRFLHNKAWVSVARNVPGRETLGQSNKGRISSHLARWPLDPGWKPHWGPRAEAAPYISPRASSCCLPNSSTRERFLPVAHAGFLCWPTCCFIIKNPLSSADTLPSMSTLTGILAQTEREFTIE